MVNRIGLVRRVLALCRRSLWIGLLCACMPAYALRVESGYVSLDISQPGMILSYGPEQIIVSGDFYLADRDWKSIFPDAASYEIVRSGAVVTKRTRKNPLIKAEIIHTLSADGVKVEIAAEVFPNSGACFCVWDIFLSKPVFSNATVKRAGQPPLTLDPKHWATIGADNLTLGTANGDWVLTLAADTAAQWNLRSVCDRPWGPEEKKTFTLLHNFQNVPAEGMKEKLSFEARFIPRPEYLAKIEDRFAEKVSSYLQALLARYGSPPKTDDMPKEPAKQAEWLAHKVCAASANLDANGLDPRAGIVIPEPKSYKKETGVFAVPPTLDVACSGEHEAALELLAGDLARHGVKARRAESAAKPPLLMGVPMKDPAVADACKRLGITVDEKTPGPEGYALAVTPQEVLIAGSDDAGVFYGAQTLRQLIRPGAGGAEIPAVTISDRPDMKFRGFYVESAGRIADSEDLRRLIRDTYSYFKANAIVLHVRWGDFRWQSHPEVSAPNALPLEDLASIADYARRFHLDVIPVVFSYGKVQDLLRAHPEIAEDPDSRTKRGESAYCPNKPETYALLFDIMKEIIAATKCRRMHIGHDEIMGMALCPVCRNIPPADLFAGDVNKIAGWLAERSVETMIWGDFLLDRERWEPLGVSSANSGSPYYGGHVVHPALAKIRKDVIIADWHYNVAKTFPSLKHFADNGFRVIACPWHKSENNYYLAQEEKAMGGMGVLVTDWGFLATRSPGANSIVGAVCAWNAATPEPKRLAWSPEAVLAGSILDKGKPSRMRGAVFAPVPIEAAGNRALTGDEKAWFGEGERHDFSYLPTGALRLFGVDYLIGKRCVVADGKAPALRIPVNAKAKGLVFLQALSVQNPSVGLATYGQYRVTYASGEKAEVPIDGRNATHWLTEMPRQNPWMPWIYGYTWDATLAWEGCTKSGEAVNLQAYEWVNPRPDDPISMVELAARQNVPGLMIGLVAMTAVR